MFKTFRKALIIIFSVIKHQRRGCVIGVHAYGSSFSPHSVSLALVTFLGIWVRISVIQASHSDHFASNEQINPRLSMIARFL